MLHPRTLIIQKLVSERYLQKMLSEEIKYAAWPVFSPSRWLEGSASVAGSLFLPR